eukprot:CAMPEP_0116147804 /NCGR_PEP_ID=MMETSP0329-20121206/17975_1 /TAXON_ID=697910 /ORGANISM="Pseudo-nitzschia arenysensis, Strain B593" /LENGTH=887 /DNA_ID=CAMNT_0003643807 /DNA_START=44 /DNA_END=2710 /DNA_ORIENTATION=+
MAVATDAENAISVSISDENTSKMTLPTLQARTSLSSRMSSNEESNKVLRASNSAQRLSNLKKKISSFASKRSDSYQKIDSSINTNSSNQNWNDDSSLQKRSDTPTNSEPPSRRGVRRRRSFDDNFHSLYKEAVMSLAESDYLGNPQSADGLPLHEGTDSNSEDYSFVPNALSSPTLSYKSPGTSVSSSSKYSDKSSNSNDLLTRAAAVAGRKQRKQPTAGTSKRSTSSSSDLATPATAPLGQKLSAPQPGYSSSPHLSARIVSSKQETNRRQSDPAVDLSLFSNKLMNGAVTSTPRTRRRSKRIIPNETVMQHSNEGQSDEERRKSLFRSDFPGEPIPSDSILVRLYGNMTVPPPPPPPILSPKDLSKHSDHSNAISFNTEPEWKAWNDSEKSRRKRNPNDESRRSESSKSKSSMASYRRSSSNPKLADSGDRSHSHSHSHSHSGSRVRGQKTRHSETKSKSNRRREGSSHGEDFASPKSRSRKKAETMKVRSKSSSKKSLSDEALSPSNNSDYEAFQALLNLSNGSFFENEDEFADFKTSGSGELLRPPLHKTNSAPKMNTTFNDSVNSFGSFAEGDDKADKERKKKRKGKRADKEGKVRSRSADENRSTSTKSRKGRRSSKTKTSKTDPKFNDSKNSSSASWLNDSDSLLFDSSLRGQQWTSNSERGPGRQYKSPKLLARKNSCPDNAMKVPKKPKSPKYSNKKELTSGSPGSLSTRKRSKKPSSLRSMALVSQASGDSKRTGNEVNVVEDEEQYEFPLSSWGEEPAQPKRVTVEDIVAAAKDLLVSPRVELKSVGKTRWDAEPTPMVNLTLQKNDSDSDAAKALPVADAPAPPPPPPTTPPKSHKKLDFPLNFVEYEDVSPLTVGSKKVELNVKLMTALEYLES